MGQKVNPNGLRIGISRPWSSTWYSDRKQFAKLLKQDIEIRNYLEPKLKDAGLSRIDIQRTKSLTIVIFVQRPGVVLGQDGSRLNELKVGLEKIVNGKVTKKQRENRRKSDVDIKISLVEVMNPDLDASLVAQSIASQLEGRASFRSVQKKAIQRVMRAGAKGVKTATGGRLNGAEIARSEEYKDGALGLETLSNNIDYALAEAHTIYGVIGVKVWIARPDNFKEDVASERPARKFNNSGDRNGRRGFNPNFKGKAASKEEVKPAVLPSNETSEKGE